jgi:hypothetical protein
VVLDGDWRTCGDTAGRSCNQAVQKIIQHSSPGGKAE